MRLDSIDYRSLPGDTSDAVASVLLRADCVATGRSDGGEPLARSAAPNSRGRRRARRGIRALDETRMGEARATRPATASADRGWLCGVGRQIKFCISGLVPCHGGYGPAPLSLPRPL